MNNKFFDEEAIEKVIEHEKTEKYMNKEKAKFNKVNANTGNLEGSSYNYKNAELLEAFIGPNYKNMMKRDFSIWAFIFGPMHYLYWKMYTYGTFIIILESLLVGSLEVLTKSWVAGLVDFILRLFFAATFKEMYVNFAIKRVLEIKKQYIGQDLKEVCRRKGGPSIIKAILYIFVVEAVVFLLLFALLSKK